jgi:arginase
MTGSIAMVGSPTALGGHIGGMERTPGELRRLGLVARLEDRPGFAGVEIRDEGDAENEPGWAPDSDPRAKNRAAICAYLSRLADRVAEAIGGTDLLAGADAEADRRLLAIGGDCTTHAGAMAGIRRARPGIRLAVAWFDAHGDFNTPDTTPSGNVWGMPFAMICGRGEADLLAACEAPTAREEDAALLGGQVLDETESRMLAASRVAHFGAGMLGTDGGQAALAAWARTVAARVDAFYVAFDMDALDAAGGWALTMPEPGGLSLEVAVATTRAIATAGPVVGFGATAILIGRGGDPERTADAVAMLAEAALGA